MQLHDALNKIERELKWILSLLVLTFFSFSSFSQSKSAQFDKLAEQLHALSRNSPVEFIYIQTNKDTYETGEDLWFKAYLLHVQSFIPTVSSRTVYLQLVNEESGEVIWEEKYEAAHGSASGQVYLKDNLPEGNYLLRAFTAQSFYDDSGEFKSIRKIRIIANIRSIEASTGRQPEPGERIKDIQLNTFPEGGKLFYGIESRLALKAVDTAGFPLTVSGTLFENNQPLLEFKTIHAGMGSVVFTPRAGKKYHIRLKESATDSMFLLPEPFPGGMSLRLTGRDSSHLEFLISQSTGSKERRIYLRGQLRGITCCMASGIVGNELRLRIPLKGFLQQGIAEFTLFDDKMLPVVERLVYVHPKKRLYIKMQLSKPEYARREKAVLKIKTTDENNQPVSAGVGISVYDSIYHNPLDPKNILEHCYLSTQLKGRIYDPAFYFDEKNEDRHEALDLLLLTQGWRNYVWSEESLAVYKNANQPVISDSITGEVHFTKKLKQAPKGEQVVMIFTPDKTGKPEQTAFITANLAAKFMINPEHLKMAHGSYLYLKPMGSNEFGPLISLRDPFQIINKLAKSKQVVYPLPPLANVDEPIEPLPLLLDSRVFRLLEVVITGKGNATFRDKYIGYLDSLTKQDLCHDFVCHKHHTLNCFQCTEDPRDLKPVDGKNYWANFGEHGEILGADYPFKHWFGTRQVTYHYPQLTEEELLTRNNLSRIKGYYVYREFYQPDYDKESTDNLLSDARNTLAWAPSVRTDEHGEAVLEFFCSDINTRFTVEAEGISTEGLPGIANLKFTVMETEVTDGGR